MRGGRAAKAGAPSAPPLLLGEYEALGPFNDAVRERIASGRAPLGVCTRRDMHPDESRQLTIEVLNGTVAAYMTSWEILGVLCGARGRLEGAIEGLLSSP